MMKIILGEQFRVRDEVEHGTPEQNQDVQEILAAVKRDQDAALMHYTEKHDQVRLQKIKVEQTEIQAAYADVSESFLTAFQLAAENIRAFHEKQKRTSTIEFQENGTILGQIIRPLNRVGLYVPGGTASYPSSLMMNVIPAQVAGVREIAVVTPPATGGKAGIDPYILVAAAELGVTEVYQVGGAQAIAALAYGTESIPSVDKICGPGNAYVALAKRSVYGIVDIDSIAGPTDIAILADETANPAFVAADLLSQAEHDELAAAILVTTSRQLAEAVAKEVNIQLDTLPRRKIAAKSLEDNGAIVLVHSLDEAVQMINNIAPEHLELITDEGFELVGRIENAGAIFVGPYSTEPVGDYFAGPNHILPTYGTARFSSPLNVDDFIKKSSLISYSQAALQKHGKHIVEIAKQEQLEGHARAVQIRLDEQRGK